MVSTIISFIRRKVFRIGRYRWDHQYAAGRWDRLRTEETQRLHIAKEFLDRYAAGGNILEIGCGEGIFFRSTLGVDYRFYEGIDLSELAINKIQKTGNSSFRSADMEKYLPAHYPFSVIVLNEVLYYSKNPIALLKRYTRYLAKDGIFLIGMNDIEKCEPLWISLSKAFTEIDSVKIQESSMAWYYKTFKVK